MNVSARWLHIHTATGSRMGKSDTQWMNADKEPGICNKLMKVPDPQNLDIRCYSSTEVVKAVQ